MPHAHARRHAHEHALTRTRERRHRLATEAARLMAEGGIRDYHQAKLKAATRLGIHDDASLPRNREIEDALREYQRLFTGDAHAEGLRARREAALRALDFFHGFSRRASSISRLRGNEASSWIPSRVAALSLAWW